tara:strand:+ start:23755 stop:24564 length:810 start_codon:yes stop_codon:yes gene_type:complete
MLIWKNTSTLDGYDHDLIFSEDRNQAQIALLGSKSIELDEFPNLKGIFRAGIGKDNVPEIEAKQRGILVKYPAKDTIEIIYNETAAFTCNLIFRMFYSDIGTINPWYKMDRNALASKNLLVIGSGNIGSRVAKNMHPFTNVYTYDIINNKDSELPGLINNADCISLHIPKSSDNDAFINRDRLALMKDGAILINTSRGSIVDENALYDEINSDRLRAAFDVFWEEPYSGKLKKFHPNKFHMSPHIASTCSEFLSGCRQGLDMLIKEISL